MVRLVRRVILLALVLVSPAEAEGNFRFVVLDVGEGQAVLLQRGESGLLIDTGHFGRAAGVVKSMGEYGVVHLDSIILTHLHPDHASGIFRVMESFPRAVIYETGHRIPFNPHLDGYRWVAEALDSKQWRVKPIKAGDDLSWQGVKLSVLWPRESSGMSLNGNSLVIVVEYQGARFLIMGDVGQSEEGMLLREGNLPQRVEVLVVGHHGARDATASEFLQRTRVGNYVISVNKDNKRGYPDCDVIARIQGMGERLHLTSTGGDFVWNFSSSGFE